MSLLDNNKMDIRTPVIPSVLAQTAPSIYDPIVNTPFSRGSPFGLQQHQISPWFPSIPAIACGAGLFSFNIEGLPDKGVNIPINDEELTALQIQMDMDNRGLFFTSDDDVSGNIFVGKDNIKTNQGDDFDVKNLFNNCRTLAFSSTGDVKIRTPVPATPASDKVNTIIFGSNIYNPYGPASSNLACKGSADCFMGSVTEIVDGDTLDVNNVRVRLALVNTPEVGDQGYDEAKRFTESVCPVGSQALVDEDDGQKGGSFGRLIGLVYCTGSGASLNELLLESNNAVVNERFCSVSEFANEYWVTPYGC
jgi:endonuclease YncB( thermonuclease family)